MTDPAGEPFGPRHFSPQPETRDAGKGRHRAKSAGSFWKELPFLILVALIVAVVIKTFFVQAFYIPSGSMENTLLVGDRVLVNKLAYALGEPERGDVVVFDSPFAPDNNGENILQAAVRNVKEALGIGLAPTDFIKRVVAVGGDTVEVRDNRLLVNGQVVDEPYLHPNSRMPDFVLTHVPAGHLFVMGDNRNRSQDSRFFGAIPLDDAVGQAFVVLWPLGRTSFL